MKTGTLLQTSAIVLAATLWSATGSARAGSYEQARELFEQRQWAAAVDLLTREVRDNPGHEAAQLLLMDAYVQLGEKDKAIQTAQDILKLSTSEANLDRARLVYVRLMREKIDKSDDPTQGKTDRIDAFHIDMPEIDEETWTRLAIVEDTETITLPDGKRAPPFSYDTKHFTAYAHNEELAKLTAERAEIYLDFMSKHLFGDREWAIHVPLFVFQNEEAYISVGGNPEGSHGVTKGTQVGRTREVSLFQLIEIEDADRNRHIVVYRYALESILPHELTHMVLNEFFGLETPQWLHEAVAGRMEQTREHYLEAARLSRAVVAGEHFRMRELFDQEGYPSARIDLFYEQAAIVVLYLFEAGPEAMYTFFSTLADHPKETRHDAACAALLGIPQEGAVEEFERRWVEWMTRRYARDLKPDEGEDPPIVVDVNTDDTFFPRVNELDTVANIANWRTIDLSNMEQFIGIGGSKADWSYERNLLRCDPGAKGGSFLGLRMNERMPLAVECEVRWLGNVTEGYGWVGFNQLNSDNLDTNVAVTARFSDGAAHKLTAILHDELALYIDKTLAGRYPAYILKETDRDIDYPLAAMTNSPIEILSMRVGAIEKFSTAPVDKSIIAGQAESAAPEEGKEGESGRRRPSKPSAPIG